MIQFKGSLYPIVYVLLKLNVLKTRVVALRVNLNTTLISFNNSAFPISRMPTYRGNNRRSTPKRAEFLRFITVPPGVVC